MRQSSWLYLVALLVAAALLAVLPFAAAVQLPYGANTTEFNNQTAPIPFPHENNAVAGNVTAMNLAALTTTQSWQGYYGNVSGTVQLANSAGAVFYNWSDASPTGQVFASMNNTVNWYWLQCFNYTATGAETGTAGETPGQNNLNGMNLSQLQNYFGIVPTAPDSVNNTFNLNGTGAFNTFYVASMEFNASNSSTDCQASHLFSNGASTPNFQEVLQYDPSTNAVVFTSILTNNQVGFDGVTHDFEMLVLDNGHGTNTTTTPYYFYVQLQ